MEERRAFTDEMLEVLRSLKGKTLKSYEASLGGLSGKEALEVVGLNTGSSSVRIFRIEETRTYFGEPDDDLAPLECYEFGLDVPFVAQFSYEQPHRYLIGERIVGVEVVRDTGEWREEGVVDTLVEDVALVIRTSRHVLILRSEPGTFMGIGVECGEADGSMVVPGTDFFWDPSEPEVFSVKREVLEL